MANSARKVKPNFNPFDVLGIKPGCSAQEVDKAFKKSALKWHPDKNPKNIEKAKEMFLKIAEAYDYLKDDATRIEWEEAEAAKQRRAQYEEDRRATSSETRKHLINKLAERERQAKGSSAQDASQRAGAKRRTREEQQAAAERKRARDSSLERLAREAAEMMAQHRAKKEAEEAAAARATSSNPSMPTNLSAEDFAKFEAEVLGGL